jgi:hypothetical protein
MVKRKYYGNAIVEPRGYSRIIPVGWLGIKLHGGPTLRMLLIGENESSLTQGY